MWVSSMCDHLQEHNDDYLACQLLCHCDVAIATDLTLRANLAG